MTDKRTRRSFLQGASVAATATVAWSAPRFGIAAGASPNEALRVGVIGCGGRGSYLMERFKRQPDVRIVAVCDVHAERAEAARARAGSSEVTVTGDFREILDHPDVDAVIVATTGHWHVLPTVLACQAGKDVYVEKPLGTSVAEGRAAVNAARKYDRVVQIGTQQRSWDLYREAVEIIQNGRLGAISEVKVWDNENHYPGIGSPPDGTPPEALDWNFYLGPAPERPYNSNRYHYHYWFHDYGGGWALDWAVHHYDIVHWAMDVTAPEKAVALGGKFAFSEAQDNRQWPDTINGVLTYGPCKVAPQGFLLQYTSRSGGQGENRRTHAKSFHGTDASLYLDRSGYQIVGELRDGKKVVMDASKGGISEDQAVDVHVRTFVDNVASRKRPFADVAVGHTSTIPGHLLNIAYRTGRTIHWDAASEQVIDDPEACALLSRSYRAPWSLEV